MESNGAQSLKATIISAFLARKDDADRTRPALSAALESRPDATALLTALLNDILERKAGEDYVYGEFNLRNILKAVLILSSHSSARSQFIKDLSLLPNIVKVLKYFVSDYPPLMTATGVAGGGGNDIASAELAIGTLVRLSSAFETDTQLRQDYMVPPIGVLEVLLQLKGHPKLSAEAKIAVDVLVTKLQQPARSSSVSMPAEPIARLIEHSGSRG
jgi:hypothetical protein